METKTYIYKGETVIQLVVGNQLSILNPGDIIVTDKVINHPLFSEVSNKENKEIKNKQKKIKS